MNPSIAFNSDEDDQLPAGQQARAEDAHLNPNDPARHAEAGTPAYGEFGKPENVDAAQKPGRDGSNDNPDEFSELRDPEDANQAPAKPEDQRGHVEQNQDPHGVRAAQDAEADEQRAAWADDDPRYAGGKPKATWQENNDKEHSNK
ncbi:hypothetical protein QMK33_05955 [Hymenobacter sp. H14-R3]|uniref:hypothetical protein n=1 Tax=Hymenobacter sp. H14-R3 TaxID=3046308 RepID=UPI0024B906CB|nr:hypothetical protein [Hymenobacter sp. H14-R3]MDJ0364690.1 hypothetical protein [Hymenobacter sp. H14-R3]